MVELLWRTSNSRYSLSRLQTKEQEEDEEEEEDEEDASQDLVRFRI